MSSLPKCPEVCRDCVSGIHILHVLNELGDISASKGEDGRIVISGYAEDDLWLRKLLKQIKCSTY